MTAHPTVLTRLLRYVRFDTQSDESSSTRPSTAKQRDLLRALHDELLELGVPDVSIDEHDYVIARLPGNVDVDVPAVGFIAHVDTSPEMSGSNVQPQLHENYGGGALELGHGYTLTPERSPELLDHLGHTIVTTDGTTLLGADNKAGVAEIMTMLERLMADPAPPHGPVHVAFTYDEEIGRGTETFDVERFGAEYAYTVDGETVGHIENETFCADAARVLLRGVNV
ncbi:MAG: tripeptide aminopeptidase PepT, partial [Myxococcales bacterium]|nr:tripeptide aminopeptidase PepT [Myxococcales bacterium]